MHHGIGHMDIDLGSYSTPPHSPDIRPGTYPNLFTCGPTPNWYWHLMEATKNVQLASGRYASYWNAFLFHIIVCFCQINNIDPVEHLPYVVDLSRLRCNFNYSQQVTWIVDKDGDDYLCQWPYSCDSLYL